MYSASEHEQIGLYRIQSLNTTSKNVDDDRLFFDTQLL